MKSIVQFFKSMSLPLLLVVMATVPAGCGSYSTGDSRDVESDSIYGDYRVEIDANKSEIELFSQFRFAGSDGTTLRLNWPASVRVSGGFLCDKWVEMREVKKLGTSYSWHLSSNFAPAEFCFEYTRPDGGRFVQRVLAHKPPVLKIPTGTVTISREKNLAVEFSLDNKVDYRSAVCKIEDAMGESSVSANTRGTKCMFSADDLERLPMGDAYITVQATWSSSSVLGHQNVGGEKRVESTSLKYLIRI